MLSEHIESETNSIPKGNDTLCLITDRAPPPPRVLCAYSKGNNREPTQRDNWKAPKYAWSLSKNSVDWSNNECFFFRLAFPRILVSHAYLKWRYNKGGIVPWLYISSYYGSLVRLYKSDDYRTKGPVIITGFIYFDCFMREQLVDRGIVQVGLYQANTPPHHVHEGLSGYYRYFLEIPVLLTCTLPTMIFCTNMTCV